MDVSLDSIALPHWDPNTGRDWDDAFEKVENYLRACRIASRLHRARLAAMILRHAYETRAADNDPNQSLAVVAITEARDLLEQWVAGLEDKMDHPLTPAEGMVALYLCDAPTRWPGAFINPQQMPKEFKETLHVRIVQAGPELQVSSMVPRPFDYGLLPELAGSTMGTLARWPLLRAMLGWVLFVAFLVFMFWKTRGH